MVAGAAKARRCAAAVANQPPRCTVRALLRALPRRARRRAEPRPALAHARATDRGRE